MHFENKSCWSITSSLELVCYLIQEKVQQTKITAALLRCDIMKIKTHVQNICVHWFMMTQPILFSDFEDRLGNTKLD